MFELKKAYAYDPVEFLIFCKVNTAMRKLSFRSNMDKAIHRPVNYHGFLEVMMRIVQTLSRGNGFSSIEHLLCLEGAKELKLSLC